MELTFNSSISSYKVPSSLSGSDTDRAFAAGSQGEKVSLAAQTKKRQAESIPTFNTSRITELIHNDSYLTIMLFRKDVTNGQQSN